MKSKKIITTRNSGRPADWSIKKSMERAIASKKSKSYTLEIPNNATQKQTEKLISEFAKKIHKSRNDF